MAKSSGSKPLTKSAILDRLATETELPKRKVGEMLDALTQLAYSEARKGFTIPGLGKLICANRKARMGRNPQTGEAIKIPARTVLRFRVGKQAKDAILGGSTSKGGSKAKAGAKKTAAKGKKTAAKGRR